LIKSKPVVHMIGSVGITVIRRVALGKFLKWRERRRRQNNAQPISAPAVREFHPYSIGYILVSHKMVGCGCMHTVADLDGFHSDEQVAA